MSWSDIQQIPLRHRASLRLLLRECVIGWGAEASHNYMTFTLLHQILQTVRAVTGNKTQEHMEFSELYPVQESMLKRGKRPTLAQKAKAMMDKYRD